MNDYAGMLADIPEIQPHPIFLGHSNLTISLKYVGEHPICPENEIFHLLDVLNPSAKDRYVEEICYMLKEKNEASILLPGVLYPSSFVQMITFEARRAGGKTRDAVRRSTVYISDFDSTDRCINPMDIGRYSDMQKDGLKRAISYAEFSILHHEAIKVSAGQDYIPEKHRFLVLLDSRVKDSIDKSCTAPSTAVNRSVIYVTRNRAEISEARAYIETNYPFSKPEIFYNCGSCGGGLREGPKHIHCTCCGQTYKGSNLKGIGNSIALPEKVRIRVPSLRDKSGGKELEWADEANRPNIIRQYRDQELEYRL